MIQPADVAPLQARSSLTAGSSGELAGQRLDRPPLRQRAAKGAAIRSDERDHYPERRVVTQPATAHSGAWLGPAERIHSVPSPDSLARVLTREVTGALAPCALSQWTP